MFTCKNPRNMNLATVVIVIALDDALTMQRGIAAAVLGTIKVYIN